MLSKLAQRPQLNNDEVNAAAELQCFFVEGNLFSGPLQLQQQPSL